MNGNSVQRNPITTGSIASLAVQRARPIWESGLKAKTADRRSHEVILKLERELTYPRQTDALFL